jgi:hypothetical protein
MSQPVACVGFTDCVPAIGGHGAGQEARGDYHIRSSFCCVHAPCLPPPWLSALEQESESALVALEGEYSRLMKEAEEASARHTRIVAVGAGTYIPHALRDIVCACDSVCALRGLHLPAPYTVVMHDSAHPSTPSTIPAPTGVLATSHSDPCPCMPPHSNHDYALRSCAQTGLPTTGK